MTSTSLRAKHRERAVLAIAGHLCSSELTDGFCAPRSTEPGRDPRCCRGGRADCVGRAEGVLRALASRGVVAAWAHDRELPKSLRMMLRLLADGSGAD